MRKAVQSVLRTSPTISFCLLLISFSYAANCQTTVRSGKNAQDAPSTGKAPTTAELARCVGLNGLLTKPEDIERWKAVMTALQHTASLGYSWEAMYAVGREFEFPSVKGTAPDWNTAAYYYLNAANRGDYRAKYHLGSLYVRDLVPGVHERQTGRMMMLSAEDHGYSASTDAIDTSDHSANVLPVLAGLAALLVLAQHGSANVSGSNVDRPKTCQIVHYEQWVPEVPYGGHYEDRTKCQ